MREQNQTTTHRRLAGATLALAMLLTACADGNEDPEATASMAADAGEPNGESLASPEPTGGEPDALLEPPTDGSTDVEPGTYDLAVIGAPSATFTIDDGPWHFTKVGSAGISIPLSDQMVMLSPTRIPVEGRRNLQLTRPTHLVDPTFFGPPVPSAIDPGEDLLPPTGIDDWLAEAEVGGEWGVTDVETVEVSGRAATRFALEPDIVGCENMEAMAPGVRGDWTGCNATVAWDLESGDDGLGRLAIEGWDGGRNEYLWIHDVDGAPLVVSIHLGYEIDEEWAARARAVLESVTVS